MLATVCQLSLQYYITIVTFIWFRVSDEYGPRHFLHNGKVHSLCTLPFPHLTKMEFPNNFALGTSSGLITLLRCSQITSTWNSIFHSHQCCYWLLSYNMISTHFHFLFQSCFSLSHWVGFILPLSTVSGPMSQFLTEIKPLPTVCTSSASSASFSTSSPATSSVIPFQYKHCCSFFTKEKSLSLLGPLFVFKMSNCMPCILWCRGQPGGMMINYMFHEAANLG